MKEKAIKSLIIFTILSSVLSLIQNKNGTKIIYYTNEYNVSCSIEGSQSYEIQFPADDEDLPKFLHITIKSENNIRQKVYYSNEDSQCKRNAKYLSEYIEGQNDIVLTQQELEKNVFICVECEENEFCKFKILLKGEEKVEKIPKMATRSRKEHTKINEAEANAEEIKLYVLSSSYDEYLQIPSDDAHPKYYQIPNSTGKTFKVDGESVTVTSEGLVVPFNETWYRYGNMWITMKYDDVEPDDVRIDYEPGISTVIVKDKEKSTSKNITFNVLNYAVIYADGVLDDYYKNNVSKISDELKKLENITSYPATYNYSAYASGYVSMIIKQGGDCWASTSIILQLCKRANIKAHGRNGNKEVGAGSGHMNVAAMIKKEVYVCEAGYSGNAPRYWDVYKENIGYFLRYVSTGKYKILQYDGWDNDIKVPTVIENKTIVGIGETCFTDAAEDVNSVTLPDSITFIEDSAFCSTNIKTITIPPNVDTLGVNLFAGCDKLTEIKVHKDNQNFIMVKEALYTINKTILWTYPSALNKTFFVVPDKTEVICECAFRYNKYLKAIYLSKTVNYLGQQAFSLSHINETYFYGDKPTFENYIFYSVSKVTCYYPNITSWSGDMPETRASKIEWIAYDEEDPPKKPTEKSKSNKKTGLIVGVAVGVIAVIAIAIAVICIVKKAKGNNGGSIESGIGLINIK